jgi:hypothetical protein
MSAPKGSESYATIRTNAKNYVSFQSRCEQVCGEGKRSLTKSGWRQKEITQPSINRLYGDWGALLKIGRASAFAPGVIRRFDLAATKPPVETLLTLGTRSFVSEQQRNYVRFAPVGSFACKSPMRDLQ